MARATIIVTAHNIQQYIGAAIRSVLDQTERDLKVIVVDDGSTDGTPLEIQAALQSDDRVQLISGANRGFTQVLADTIPQIETPYFGWVDGDDILLPEAVRLCADFLDEHPNCGLAYTKYFNMSEDGRDLGIGARSVVPYSMDRMLVDFMTFHFRLIRKAAYDLTGGIDRSFETGQDYDLCLKLAEVANVGHIPQGLYRYRTRPGAVSSQKRVLQIEDSRRAVEAALRRRGMDGTHQLLVEIYAKFTLVKKNQM